MRSNSISSFSQFNSGNRLNSLSSRNSYAGGPGGYRSNSLRSNGSFRSNNPNAQPIEKIIITKTTDELGRTKSITTETIKQVGSFQIRKTETKNMDLSGFLQPNLHSFENNTNNNELSSIAEEFEDVADYNYEHDGYQDDHETNSIQLRSPKLIKINKNSSISPPSQPQPAHTPPPPTQAPAKPILKNAPVAKPKLSSNENHAHRNNANNGDDDDNDSNSDSDVFSDAIDNLDSNLKTLKNDFTKPSPNSVDYQHRTHSITSNSHPFRAYSLSSQSKYSRPAHQPHQPPQKQLTEQEMYDKAYAIAMKKVYGDQSEQQANNTGNAQSQKFKNYSLRSSSNSSTRRASSNSGGDMTTPALSVTSTAPSTAPAAAPASQRNSFQSIRRFSLKGKNSLHDQYEEQKKQQDGFKPEINKTIELKPQRSVEIVEDYQKQIPQSSSFKTDKVSNQPKKKKNWFKSLFTKNTVKV